MNINAISISYLLNIHRASVDIVTIVIKLARIFDFIPPSGVIITNTKMIAVIIPNIIIN